eukprot:scaffold527_cov368-Prasinococcus_capsulatus_cf.AAC.16
MYPPAPRAAVGHTPRAGRVRVPVRHAHSHRVAARACAVGREAPRAGAGAVGGGPPRRARSCAGRRDGDREAGACDLATRGTQCGGGVLRRAGGGQPPGREGDRGEGPALQCWSGRPRVLAVRGARATLHIACVGYRTPGQVERALVSASVLAVCAEHSSQAPRGGRGVLPA